MKYNELGKTGIGVSEIGFGASPLGNVFGEVSSGKVDASVAIAIEEGINIFDVSPYYGFTLAENRLGQALRGRRSSIYLATKCGRYGVDKFNFSEQAIVEGFEKSLARLQTDHVDILQAHDIEFGSLNQILNETLPAMSRLKEQGKVRFIGVTSYWPGLLARVLQSFEVDCVLNYCHANLFMDDMFCELVPVAKQHAVGLLNASPLHMGLLSDKLPPDWHPAPLQVRAAASQVRTIAHEYGIDPVMLGLRFAIEHKEVASTFIGISGPEEVMAAITATNVSLPDELVERVSAVVAPVHNIVWPSGLLENQDKGEATEMCANGTH